MQNHHFTLVLDYEFHLIKRPKIQTVYTVTFENWTIFTRSITLCYNHMYKRNSISPY